MLRSDRFVPCAILALLTSMESVRASELYGSSVVRQMLITLDMETGAASDVGFLGDYIQDITFDSIDGFIYGFEFQEDQTLRRIDPADGTNVPVGQPITDYGWSHVHGMAYSPERDRLFATTFYGELLSVNPSTGTPTHVGTLPGRAWGLAYNTLDQSLFSVTWGSNGVLWEIDPDDASFNVIGELGLDGAIEGLAFDPIGQQLLAVVIHDPLEDSLLIGIDPLTAATTPIGELGSNDFISGLAYVPEPATLVMVALAGMLGAVRRCGH